MFIQPGRVEAIRPAPVCVGAPEARSWTLRSAALCAALLLLGACVGTPSDGPPHRQLDALWAEYSELPGYRAIAIAGQLRSNRWVAGVTGGHASAEAARDVAMRECGKRRSQKRMQAPCQLYAIGDEVVWQGGG